MRSKPPITITSQPEAGTILALQPCHRNTLSTVSTSSPDQALAQIFQELQQLRASMQSLDIRFEELVAENRALHQQLGKSEEARRELFRQAKHLIHELDLANQQVEGLRGQIGK